MTSSYNMVGNKIINLGDREKIIDLDRGNLYLGEGKGEVFLPREYAKDLVDSFRLFSDSKISDVLPYYNKDGSYKHEDGVNLNGTCELTYDNGKIGLVDASGRVYKDIEKYDKNFNFYRYISQLGLERTGLAGGEAGEVSKNEKKGFWERHKTLKKVGGAIGVGLIGAGIAFGAGLIGNQYQEDSHKITLEDHVYENMEKINNTLHEKEFSYCHDNITDNVNLYEIVPYNFERGGQGFSSIGITIDDNKIPEDIKTFKALVDLGSVLKSDEENAPQMNCYKFLVGDKEDYSINMFLPVLDHPNDIIYPSKLIKTKAGDCEDYSLLYASYYNSQNIPSFIVIDKGHAVAAVGDIPSNPDEFRENIRENKTFVIGSSEYLDKSFNFSTTTEPIYTGDVLDNLKKKYSSANIRAIISKENTWIKDPDSSDVSEFEYLDKERDKERAKESADYLKRNISEEQIDEMSDKYHEFHEILINKAIDAQVENRKEFYQEIKNVLNDPYEEKAAENLFNETSINNF